MDELFKKVENEIRAAEKYLGADLSKLVAAVKGHFELHAEASKQAETPKAPE